MRFFKLPRYRPSRGAAAAATAFAGLAAGGWYLLSQPRLFDRWVHAQIVDLSDEELESWLSGLLDQEGPAAIPLVVEDLAASRPAVRRAAMNALLREIVRWDAGTAPFDTRAIAMAEAIRTLPPTVRESAGAELSARILAWADRTDRSPTVRNKLRTALTVVKSSPRVVRSAGEIWPTTVETPSPDTAGFGDAARPLSTAPAIQRGSGPPKQLAISAAQSSPRLLAPHESDRELHGDDEGNWELSPRSVDPLAERPEPTEQVPAAPQPPSAEASATLRKLTTRELISGLRGEQPELVRQELQSRGFDAEALDLATHLSSADRQERRQWTEALPRIANIDARAWLTWMTEDADAEVRRVALTLLATSLDESTLSLLRNLAARDPDRSIRQLAGELIRRQ